MLQEQNLGRIMESSYGLLVECTWCFSYRSFFYLLSYSCSSLFRIINAMSLNIVDTLMRRKVLMSVKSADITMTVLVFSPLLEN